MGARSAVAIDHDEQALTATQSNAALNGLDAQGTLCVAYPDACPVGPYSLVVANILAKPLLGLVDVLVGQLAHEGTLVLSGLLASDADAIRAAYRVALVERECTELDGWLRMVWQRGD